MEQIKLRDWDEAAVDWVGIERKLLEGDRTQQRRAAVVAEDARGGLDLAVESDGDDPDLAIYGSAVGKNEAAVCTWPHTELLEDVARNPGVDSTGVDNGVNREERSRVAGSDLDSVLECSH